MMRSFFLYPILFIALASPLYAQGWQVVGFPLEENINGITFVGPDTAFAVTATGKLVRSFDRGDNWEILNIAPGVSLEDVHFLDSNIGFACGSKGRVVHTSDGGRTWGNQVLGDTACWLFDIEMFDGNTGIVIGMTRQKESPFGGLAYRTTDGGKTWKKQKPIGLGYSEIFYRPGNPVYFLSFGKINYSEDLGKSWKSSVTIEGQPARALALYGSSGIICGIQGMCAYTGDGGRTWLPSHQDKSKVFIAAELIDEKIGYIGGAKSTILRTTDGGKTWSQELMAKSFDVFDFYPISDRLYAVGSDGGIIWKKVK